MTGTKRDRRHVAADVAGRALRLIDRLCAVGYVAFCAWVVRDLWVTAEARGWIVLVLAIPVLISSALLFPSLFGRPDQLLRTWQPNREQWHKTYNFLCGRRGQ